MKTYHGYTIKKHELGHTIVMPNGDTMTEVACNLKTAVKWIEQHQGEVRQRVSRTSN
jgi:predicted NBD/HSP70 family sugar kinase